MRPALARFWQFGVDHGTFVSLCAGALATLALPPADFMPAFLALGFVFYRAAYASHWRESCLYIGAGAYGWFFASLYWISNSLLVGTADYWFLIPFSLFGIPVIVSLFWVVGAGIGFRIARTKAGRMVMMAVMVGLSEWAREFVATGFPWNAPGLIVLSNDFTASLPAYFGQTGCNFLVLFAVILLPLFLHYKYENSGKIPRIIPLAIAVVFIVMTGLLSYAHRQMTPLNPVDEASGIRVVQPAVPQAEKWQRDKRDNHLTRLEQLSLAPSNRVIDLVIWPETAFAGDYHREASLFDSMAKNIATAHSARGGAGQLLSGIVRFDAEDKLRNSALLIAEDGTKTLYNKTHLVPFGEYVPWRFIPFIDAIAGPVDFVAGDEVRPLFAPHFGFILPLICYEAIFPALPRRATQRPTMIINLTNDGWFGHTAGPYQHLAQTRMTAISYGIAVVRVANSGISAAFDGKGNEIAALGLGKQGVFDIARPAQYAATLFARFGTLITLCLFIVLYGVAILLDRAGKRRQV